MKTNEALERFAEVIIRKIETTTKEWEKPWYSAVLGMPRNISGRRYNASNSLVLSIYCQQRNYELPVFLTFQQVQKLNEGQPETSHVKINSKERSFPVILKTKFYRNKETGEIIYPNKYDELDEEEQEEYKELFSRRVYPVFNVHQTNMESVRPDLWKKIQSDAPVKKTPAEGALLSSFEVMRRKNGWICPIENIENHKAYYSPSDNRINLPSRNMFFQTEKYYGTAFHEMAHSTMSRFKRKHEYAIEELVAEMTSALVAVQHGYSAYINEDSIPYLKDWIAKLKAEPEIVKTILDDVQKAEGLIMSTLDQYSGYWYFEFEVA